MKVNDLKEDEGVEVLSSEDTALEDNTKMTEEGASHVGETPTLEELNDRINSLIEKAISDDAKIQELIDGQVELSDLVSKFILSKLDASAIAEEVVVTEAEDPRLSEVRDAIATLETEWTRDALNKPKRENESDDSYNTRLRSNYGMRHQMAITEHNTLLAELEALLAAKG